MTRQDSRKIPISSSFSYLSVFSLIYKKNLQRFQKKMIFENVTAALILLVNVILSYAVIEPAKTYDYQNCEYK